MTEYSRFFCDDFAELVARQGDAPALLINSALTPEQLSYQELQQQIRRCLYLFEQLGLQPGDNIAALLPNSVDTIVIFLACLAGGLGFAPLPCTSTPNEIHRWHKLIKPKQWLWSDLVSQDSWTTLFELHTPSLKILTDHLLAWLPAEFAPWPQRSRAQFSRVYLQTSGTTGQPKAMVIDGNCLWSSGHAFIHWHNPESQPLRFWNYLPMSYLGGLFNLTLIPLACGGSTVIDQAFSGKTFLGYWQTVERFKISALWLVPTIVRGLLQLAQLTRKSLTSTQRSNLFFAFLGTAPIDLATKQSFEQQFGITLLENFALSETTFFTSEHHDQDLTQRCEGSVGCPLPYVEFKFQASSIDNENELGSPTKEIWIKSPFCFLGYLDEQGALTSGRDQDGFFATGDLGYLSENNQLVVYGRKRDIIKKGGYLVYLREIEATIQLHPSVTEACAVKISHPFYGEAYRLFVVIKNGQDLTEQKLESWLHQELVQHKWPEGIIILNSLPKTTSGKIMKHLLVNQE